MPVDHAGNAGADDVLWDDPIVEVAEHLVGWVLVGDAGAQDRDQLRVERDYLLAPSLGVPGPQHEPGRGVVEPDLADLEVSQFRPAQARVPRRQVQLPSVERLEPWCRALGVRPCRGDDLGGFVGTERAITALAVLLSIVAALRDRKTMLAAGVIGSCVAVGLLLVEVSRLPGVDLGKPIRSLQPVTRK